MKSHPREVQRPRIAALLASAAQEAHAQIDERHYAAEMGGASISVLKYGIAFQGKRVALAK